MYAKRLNASHQGEAEKGDANSIQSCLKKSQAVFTCCDAPKGPEEYEFTCHVQPYFPVNWGISKRGLEHMPVLLTSTSLEASRRCGPKVPAWYFFLRHRPNCSASRSRSPDQNPMSSKVTDRGASASPTMHFRIGGLLPCCSCVEGDGSFLRGKIKSSKIASPHTHPLSLPCCISITEVL